MKTLPLWGTLFAWLGWASVTSAQTAGSPAAISPATLPEAWVGADEVVVQTLPVEDAWWTGFGDATLDSLIRLAMQQNLSVETAISRMEQARLNLNIERGAFLPSIGVNGGWTRQQTSGNTGGGSRSWSGQYNLTANMTWEVDLFGSIRQRVKAQREQFLASEEEYRGVMVALCAQVATAYFSLRQYQQEWEVLDHNCESQLAVVNLTEARNRSGLASKLDVAQARQVYYGTLAQQPAMEAAIIRTMNQLAVLLGQFPQQVVQGLSDPAPLPDYMEVVGVDVPASLIRRRPDIRQAERQVEAQAALLGAAKRDWLPRFFLDGSIGYASSELKSLPRAGSLSWQIAPSMSWTLFNGGQRTNNIRLNRAQLDEAITQYNQTVLTAMQEAATAMSAYTNSIEQIVATRQAFVQSQTALTLSLDLYKQGLTTFQSVLDAQRSLLGYEESLVQAQAASLTTLVQLYQALGGGWE
ncbi:MAG: efflux transporter outer membrane subunit [Bacteroidaceae bacterium]|nr:efflux transporter outer membrane subunit [Bacteroidaceae bacterium]